MIKYNGKYSDVSNGTKTALGQLIEYNKHDVLGMKHLVEFTQREKGSDYVDVV